MPVSTNYSPPATIPEVLYNDDDIIIVNKPANLLTVPGRGEDKQDCLVTRIQENYPEVLSVHRLDMPTSGIVVLAKNKQTQRQLGKQFQNREIHKEYIADVVGIVDKDEDLIDLPLIADWPNRPMQKVDFNTGKPSQTRYQVLNRNTQKNSTRLKLIPITGRSHQLRVHLLSIGHVILGDELYSDEQAKKNIRLHLHATRIELIQPVSGKKIIIESPCPF